MKNINVLLADDHAIVMDGIKAVLSMEEGITVTGTVENGEEAIKFVRLNPVDVVILDINMPVMDGITCTRYLKKNFPDTKVIILTMYAQKSFVEEIIKIGIDGCLLKNNTGKELKDAILRVMSGKQYYDNIGKFRSEEEVVTQYKLSNRELEIISLLSHGLNSLEIAEKLFISEHTVKTHRKNILRKLDMKNTSQVIQFATNNKLI